ncbi:MAG: adenylate/guanylate cyclase domain-containing protein [Acidimicrobiales bacterium]
MADDQGSAPSSLTFWQRQALKGAIKRAKKNPGEALSPEDWEAYFQFAAQWSTRAGKRVMRAMPSTPRCGFCCAPFAGIGARIVGPLGYRPSRKNPSVCSTCVELAPPGGMTMEIGVLFADLRGFTSDSELRTPVETSVALRRFYAHAEKVLFPEALIDKLIGDEVMALYIPAILSPGAIVVDDQIRQRTAHVMLEHARELLERVGYGSGGTPEFAVGIGLDFGEAFIGNIGDSAVHDFTAVGDVVNTASRLQGHAAAGEVLISERLAQWLPGPVGTREDIELKGKQARFEARRVQWFAERV